MTTSTIETPAAPALEVEPLILAGRTFRSRLFLGTGKYRDFETMTAALEASGTEVVTVALRRVNLDDRGKGSLLDAIDPKRYLLLPNTAGCYTADEAIRTARLARELGGDDRVKGRVAAGRVRQHLYAGGVQHIEDRAPRRRIEPPERHRAHVGAGCLKRGGQDLVVGEAAGAQDQPRLELAAGDAQSIVH